MGSSVPLSTPSISAFSKMPGVTDIAAGDATVGPKIIAPKKQEVVEEVVDMTADASAPAAPTPPAWMKADKGATGGAWGLESPGAAAPGADKEGGSGSSAAPKAEKGGGARRQNKDMLKVLEILLREKRTAEAEFKQSIGGGTIWRRPTAEQRGALEIFAKDKKDIKEHIARLTKERQGGE